MDTRAKCKLESWQGWLYLLTGNYGLKVINLIRIGIPGGMEMHTGPKNTVLEAFDIGGMRVIKAERLSGDHSAVYRYFAENS